MKFSFSFNISCVCRFGAVESAKRFIFPVYKNSRAPLTSVSTPVHPEKAGTVVAGRCAPVLLVDRFINRPEITDSVVSPNTVDVVDFTFGPNRVHVKPCKPMQSVTFTIKHGGQIPVFVDVSYFIAFSFRPTARSTPSELTCKLVEIYKRAQSFCANIWFSHDAPLMRIG